MRGHDKKLRACTVAEWEKKTQTRRDGEDRARKRQAGAPPAKTGGAGGPKQKGNLSTVKGVTEAVRSGDLSPADAAERMARIRDGAVA